MHLVGIVQSLGLFFIVCLATATLLSLAMIALARMERATVAVRPSRPTAGSTRSARAVTATPSSFSADRVSSPGSCTYGPRSR